MKYLLTALSAIILIPSVTNAGHADFNHDIDVNVNGLVCDFCARALEKVFGTREEVNAISVDLNNHLVAIDLKEGANIDDEEITKLITDSGYNVVDITRHNENTDQKL
ncbi:MAG: heavy-metal-associated domain-containing protein [Rhodospirillales bacterium]|nr:heavy-metal-associated domain-containing protein [Alphaproteobacteria bacterium]MCB9981775.1 heavy-metal-associated domain-containing protein [Rhodospirillales bacterium]